MSELIEGPDTGGVKPLNFTIPSLTDNADIQEAFKKFIYGTTTIPAEVTDITSGTFAEYMYDTRAVALAAQAGTLSVSLLGTDDLNTKTSTGFFYQASDSNATSGRHYPSFLVSGVETRYAGFLFVMSKNDVYYQEYSTSSSAASATETLTASNVVFYRTGKLTGGSVVWSTWKQISESTHNHDDRYYTETEIDTKLSTKLELASSSPLTANSVLVTDANGKGVVATAISTTELGYLDGVSSGIQSQITTVSNSLASHTHGNILNAGTVTSSVSATSPVKVLITNSSNQVGLLTTTNASSTTFLRGDGTWATPTSTGGTGTVTSVSVASGSTAAMSVANGSTTPTITVDADLVAIAALSGTSGVLKKTAANTWALDTAMPKIASGSRSISLNAESTNSQNFDITALGFSTITSVIATASSNALFASVTFASTTSITLSITHYQASNTTGNFTVYYTIFGT